MPRWPLMRCASFRSGPANRSDACYYSRLVTLRAGQFIRTTSYVTTNSSNSSAYRARHEVWESKADQSAGKAPVCNVSYLVVELS
jgi:hypothetical protein